MSSIDVKQIVDLVGNLSRWYDGKQIRELFGFTADQLSYWRSVKYKGRYIALCGRLGIYHREDVNKVYLNDHIYQEGDTRVDYDALVRHKIRLSKIVSYDVDFRMWRPSCMIEEGVTWPRGYSLLRFWATGSIVAPVRHKEAYGRRFYNVDDFHKVYADYIAKEDV